MPADPKILFTVTATVVGALVLWVAWALARTETRKDLSLQPVGSDEPAPVPASATDESASDDDA